MFFWKRSTFFGYLLVFDMIKVNPSEYEIIRDNTQCAPYPGSHRNRHYCLVEYYIRPEHYRSLLNSYERAATIDVSPTNHEHMQVADLVLAYPINISRGYVLDFFNIDISTAMIGRMLKWMDDYGIHGYNFYIDVLKNRTGFIESVPAFLFNTPEDLTAFKLAWF